MEALRQVERWPCGHAAVALVSPAGVAASHGDLDRPFGWASVSKLATAICVLVGVEEGLLALDDPLGPSGSSVRHLLAHASGLPLEGAAPVAALATRRTYSNSGFELLATHLGSLAGMPFAEYFDAVWGFPLAGSAAHGVEAPLSDLAAVARELLAPVRLSRGMLLEAASVQFAGLGGVLPGFGRYEPNDWGLGFELRDAKEPHWTGRGNSASSFGHFGRSGGFLWVDPAAGYALACLSDLDFGDWAKSAWPILSDAVLHAAADAPPPLGEWPFAA
jgi:CubicO group peptidase (beta-lactamase class C family)